MTDHVTDLLRHVEQALDAVMVTTIAESFVTIPQPIASERMDLIRSIQMAADEAARRCEFDLLKHVKGDPS